jgi:hypothetical protein
MLDKEPLSFPFRGHYVYDPGIPNRQLWAIGMIVVQWSMTEYFIDMSIRQLMEGDAALLAEYKKIRNFQQTVAFWEILIQSKAPSPYREHLTELIPVIKDLSSQRDQVVHRMWGGGMEAASPASDGLPTEDAAMMPDPGERFKTSARGGPIPPKWRATFQRLRQMAVQIADLNRSLFTASFTAGPPHGYIDKGGQVGL